MEAAAAKKPIRVIVSREELTSHNAILRHGEGSIDLTRSDLPLIVNHQQRDMLPIGRVKLEHDIDSKTLFGEVRFSKGEQAQALESDVRDGIITDISVGAEFRSDDSDVDDDDVLIINHWRPVEASLVVAGALPSAKVISMADTKNQHTLAAMFGAYKGIPDYDRLRLECYDEGINADEARQRIDNLSAKIAKEAISTSEAETAASPGHVSIVRDSSEKYIENCSQVLKLKAGLMSPDEEKKVSYDIARSEINRGSTIMDMADAYLAANGIRMSSAAKEERLRRAIKGTGNPSVMYLENAMPSFTTGDFANVITTNANTALAMGYNEIAETWSAWTVQKSLNNFQQHNFPVMSAFEDLSVVPENGEYTYGRFGDKNETMTASKYGKLFGVSMEALINDDLNALTAIPRLMGRAAQRAVGDEVYSVLTTNGTLNETSRALFNTTDGNLASADAAVTEAGLTAAYVAMRKFRGPALDSMVGTTPAETASSVGPRLGVVPRYLLVPPDIYFVAAAFLQSAMEPGTASGAKTNVFYQDLQIIDEHRLSDSDTNAWYLIADATQSNVETVGVGFIDGLSTPSFFQEDGFTVDGVVMKVRHAFATGALDWRGMFKNNGA